MTEIIKALTECELFTGISRDGIKSIIDLLAPDIRSFRKGDTIIVEGERNREIGIILSGGIVAQKISADGDASTVSEIDKNGVFGEILSGSTAISPVTVTASSVSEIMFINYDRLIDADFDDRDMYRRIIRNLIVMVSDSYFRLQKRMSLLTVGKLRQRIFAYLDSYSDAADERGFFDVPHTREAQASLFGCDRSALSRELSNMKREGLIDYYRNTFKILYRS